MSTSIETALLSLEGLSVGDAFGQMFFSVPSRALAAREPLVYRLVKDMGGLLSFSQDDQHIVFTIALPKTAPANIP